MAQRGYRPIADYAILGDGHSAALVAGDGSIDWLCWPRFDSTAAFCRLLDAEKGGWFRVGPASRHSVSRMYLDETNVLATSFQSDSGEFRLTDFVPIEHRPDRKAGGDLEPSHRVLRLVEGVRGRSRVEVEFKPTFNFARDRTDISLHHSGAVARSGGESIALFCPAHFSLDDSGAARAVIELAAGEHIWISLAYGSDPDTASASARHGEKELKHTIQFWRDWAGRCRYDGPYRRLVMRSALVLKLLTYSPTGALVAAPTTSLPEQIGGVRNWDYRYTWLRDSSLILRALEWIGYYDEAVNFFEWLERLNLHKRGKFQIMYTVEGDEHLPEITLNHMEGYRGSRPVRIGNAASTHVQLDIYGEVIDAAYLCFQHMKKRVRTETWEMLRHLAGVAASEWHQPDRSIWEMRGRPQHFLYSKLLCWVALDRATRLAKELELPADLDTWRAAREEIREAILHRGYNEEVGAFTQAFGSTALDSSALAISHSGFLPASDPRVISTSDRIREQLMSDGLVCRYRADDGLPGGEGTFILCSFWLTDTLAQQDRMELAHELFERVTRHASDLGLLSEEIDPHSGELLGNYPQGFTHLGLIRSACNLARGGRARSSSG